MTDAPCFWLITEDCPDDKSKRQADFWIEVCLDGVEPAAALFYVHATDRPVAIERLRRIAMTILASDPKDGVIIRDVLDPGWRKTAAVIDDDDDDDLPF